ncbi:acyl-CoA thioesterase [Elongatibacter sediminis]|uniref:Acyl-CoA thioesterase n=1 Tax=Elongatibacter sediminis TaxID=3119006 RepID=A0AAW9RLU2_9GAMM
MNTNTSDTTPEGSLALQTIAMPADANWNGDIFGGWLVSQMDLAGAVTARRTARGRIATVAIEGMSFLNPVPVGAVVSCYTHLLRVGRTSMRIRVEAWSRYHAEQSVKVTQGDFVFVAIDEDGNPRAVKAD